MFPDRFYPARFFANRYWPPSAGGATVTHVTFDGSARIVVSPVFTGRIQTMAAFRGTVRIGGQSE